MSDRATPQSRCPGPSARDIVFGDNDSPPSVLLEETPYEASLDDIPYHRYTSEDFARLEREKVWPAVWQWACRVEQIPQDGDYVVFDIGSHSVLIVRDGDAVRAFRNVCTHRGTQLRPPETQGWAPSFRCPFHGWTFALDGKLQQLPCAWDFPHLDRRNDLEQVRCETWGGFVFINLDGEAGALQDFIDPLGSHFQGRWDLANRTIELHVSKELPNNWKACVEAFLEAYHVYETHAQFLPISGDANAQYDVLGPHVSRFLNPTATPSPHYTEPQTQQQILERLMIVPEGTVVPAGESARTTAASAFRALLGTAWGVDLTEYSASEMLDSIQYFLFPNSFLFPGVTLNMVYRFRPVGIDRTIFDLMFLRINPDDGVPAPAPEPIKLSLAEPFTSAPGLPEAVAEVFDQDVGNLRAQWNGFLAAGSKSGQTLGLYQESRIRHFQNTLDQYIQDLGIAR